MGPLLPKLRAAGPPDATAIARLHLATVLHAYAGIFPPDAPAPTLAGLTAEWTGCLGGPPARRVFVAERDPAVGPVGVVGAGPDPGEPGVGHLFRLYVLPSEWAQGIGRRLHDAALAHLRDSGHRAATLWVLEANHRARSWYESLGWSASPARKVTFAPAGIVDIGYRRRL